jgi:hypothetical protein
MVVRSSNALTPSGLQHYLYNRRLTFAEMQDVLVGAVQRLAVAAHKRCRTDGIRRQIGTNPDRRRRMLPGPTPTPLLPSSAAVWHSAAGSAHVP